MNHETVLIQSKLDHENQTSSYFKHPKLFNIISFVTKSQLYNIWELRKLYCSRQFHQEADERFTVLGIMIFSLLAE